MMTDEGLRKSDVERLVIMFVVLVVCTVIYMLIRSSELKEEKGSACSECNSQAEVTEVAYDGEPI